MKQLKSRFIYEKPRKEEINIPKKTCKRKACNPKIKKVYVKEPKGYNWLDADRKGKNIVITFVEIVSYKNKL